jgi:hypothetical protein
MRGEDRSGLSVCCILFYSVVNYFMYFDYYFRLREVKREKNENKIK